MDKPMNRMQSPGPKVKGQIVDAPPVAIHRKVMACNCLSCGRATQPAVCETEPERAMAYVRCQFCGQRHAYYYATEENPVPRIRRL